MRCNSDYLEPTHREKQSIRTAILLKYVLEKLEKPVPEYVVSASVDVYGNLQKLNDMVVTLCAELSALDEETRDKLVYNAKDKTSRDLADWWEIHQKADKERIEKEKQEQIQKNLVETAMAKLSKEEKAALKLG